MKHTIIIIFLFAFSPVFAGTSISTQIDTIHVQDNRIWIFFSPSIDNATTCSHKTSIEISNESDTSNPNRDYILSVALAAQSSGAPVKWITSDNCSNVGRDIVRGIRIVK